MASNSVGLHKKSSRVKVTREQVFCWTSLAVFSAGDGANHDAIRDDSPSSRVCAIRTIRHTNMGHNSNPGNRRTLDSNRRNNREL
jgi:hypothetical protein